MKLEMDEQTSITACILGVAMIAGLCGMSGCYITEKTKWKAFEAGLVEKKEPIGSSTVYTKP